METKLMGVPYEQEGSVSPMQSENSGEGRGTGQRATTEIWIEIESADGKFFFPSHSPVGT